MNETMTTRINRIRTVGIPVSDQDLALAFYRDRLGFEVRIDGMFGEGMRWLEVAPPGSATSVALVRAGEAETGIDTQIRLTSTDVPSDHAALRDGGVDVDAEIIPFPVPMFVFRDIDGNRLVVVDASPDA